MKKDTLILTFLVAVLVILVSAILALVFNPYNIVGAVIGYETVSNNYSFTKAICDDEYCQDYEIVCENGSLVSQEPVTGLVPISDTWEDPRTSEQINRVCS